MPVLSPLVPVLEFTALFKEQFQGYNGTHLLFKVKYFIMYCNSVDGAVWLRPCTLFQVLP